MAPASRATTTYTIPWIAALPHERAAALEMLDEEHRKPKDFKKNASDGNSYSWGRIGDHNIVIASLPDVVYGTTAAAVTASRLVSSLPQIRIGLLVGIGAGVTGEAPDSNGITTLKHNIFLGDVAVSRPENGKGGVVPCSDRGGCKSIPRQ